MILPDARHLLDVNVLVARVFEDHIHHSVAREWLNTHGLQWSICPFTEAGFFRYASTPGMGKVSVGEAATILKNLAGQPGYHYQPMTADWHTLTAPFSKRLYGHRQITDAYLLGLAIREGLTLVTFDKAMLHLAGDHRGHLLLLNSN